MAKKNPHLVNTSKSSKYIFPIGQTPGIIVEIQDLAFMRKPVEKGSGEDFLAKQFVPSVEGFVRSDNNRRVFVEP